MGTISKGLLYILTPLCILQSALPGWSQAVKLLGTSSDTVQDETEPPPVCTTVEDFSEIGVGHSRKTWPNGSILKVHFSGKSDMLKPSEVLAIAGEWSLYCNIAFQLSSEEKSADIHVRIEPGVSSSAIGTDSRKSSPSMHLDLTNPGSRKRVILHEFGHALGLDHEHLNPEGGIRWKKDVVYAYYKEQHGWDKATVDFNVFQTLSKDRIRAGEFDPKSIMIYAIRKDFTENEYEVGWNKELSPEDKKFIDSLYSRVDGGTNRRSRPTGLAMPEIPPNESGQSPPSSQ